MVNAYFDKKIKKQNLMIYLKKGRWIVLLITFIFSLFLVESRLVNDYEIDEMFANIKVSILLCIPYILFYSYFSFVLIPLYFKVGLFRKFWTYLVSSLLLNAIIELLFQHYFISKGWLPEFEVFTLLHIVYTISSQVGTVLGLTGILYFLEIFEQVYLAKESVKHLKVWKESERKLQGTKTDFPYMLQALRGIKAKLIGGLEINKQTQASDSMLLFADILRYKLYGYDQLIVPIEEELQIVHNLIKFYNSVLDKESNVCEWELVGDSQELFIEKQLLVNIVYPFIKDSESPNFQNLICFIEIAQNQLNLTIQADYKIQDIAIQVLDKVKEIIKKHGDSIIFDVQMEDTFLIMNLCLKLTPKSIVS